MLYLSESSPINGMSRESCILNHLDQEPGHFYLTVWGQKVWGWFLDQNFVLNLKIYFLQTAGGGCGGKSAFLGDSGTFLYVNLQMWYHIEALNRGSSFMCRFGGFSGCHGNGSHELSKNRGKWAFFVICVLPKCHSPPVNRPKASVWLLKTSLIFSWSIHANYS